MRYPCFFPDGPVTERLLCILREHDAKTITTMMKEHKLRAFKKFEIISNMALLPEHISDYVQDSGYCLHDVFYGFGASVQTNYSENDDIVIQFLNTLSEVQLERLHMILQNIYPNSFYHTPYPTPYHRLGLAMQRLPRGGLANGNVAFGCPGIGNLSETAQNDIARFNNRRSISPIFDMNCVTEYAELLGISLHWLFNLSLPLYCNTQIADQVFDYYTFLQSHEQAEFVNFINDLEQRNTLNFDALWEGR